MKRPGTETNREQMTIRIPSEIRQALDEEAQARGVSTNALIRAILEQRYSVERIGIKE